MGAPWPHPFSKLGWTFFVDGLLRAWLPLFKVLALTPHQDKVIKPVSLDCDGATPVAYTRRLNFLTELTALAQLAAEFTY
jgi:hypothetical protein